jgi:hypothetical protein
MHACMRAPFITLPAPLAAAAAAACMQARLPQAIWPCDPSQLRRLPLQTPGSAVPLPRTRLHVLPHSSPHFPPRSLTLPGVPHPRHACRAMGSCCLALVRCLAVQGPSNAARATGPARAHGQQASKQASRPLAQTPRHEPSPPPPNPAKCWLTCAPPPSCWIRSRLRAAAVTILSGQVRTSQAAWDAWVANNSRPDNGAPQEPRDVSASGTVERRPRLHMAPSCCLRACLGSWSGLAQFAPHARPPSHPQAHTHTRHWGHPCSHL